MKIVLAFLLCLPVGAQTCSEFQIPVHYPARVRDGVRLPPSDECAEIPYQLTAEQYAKTLQAIIRMQDQAQELRERMAVLEVLNAELRTRVEALESPQVHTLNR